MAGELCLKGRVLGVFSLRSYYRANVLAGVITRKVLDSANDHSRLNHFISTLSPVSIAGLLATVVLLFGFQAATILANPFAIVLIAIAMLLPTDGIFAIAYASVKTMKLPDNIAAPACMIGTSNFFELAVAVAISLFGLPSGAALATLVEVPVMQTFVAFANRTRHWFDAA